MHVRRVGAIKVALPQYQTALAAGMDLVAAIDGPLTIAPLARVLVPTGIAMGCCFPLGMLRFGEAHKGWFWALNGAAGVFASAEGDALLAAHAALLARGLDCTLDRRPRIVEEDEAVAAARAVVRTACRQAGLDFMAGEGAA